FKNLNNEIAANKTDIENKLEAHKKSTNAHPAENIPYSGGVLGAGDVKQALDKLNQEVKDLILGDDDSDTNTKAEVVAARDGYDTLGDRLDVADGKLESVVEQTINVKSPPSPLSPATGDGITDDTSVLTDIFNYARTNRKAVFMPSGEYKTSSALDISGLQIYGILSGFENRSGTAIVGSGDHAL
ncbi:hypothetical protein ACP3UH_31335, partial [Klebsiella pneumoniae]